MGCDLINIKEKYGERMMHFCRKNFSTILENDGLLFYLMSSHFAYSKFLYEDIVSNLLEDRFKNYIYSLLEPVKDLPVVPETAVELLNIAGNNFLQCNMGVEIAKFPSLIYAGNWFMSANKIIKEVDFSRLKEAGNNFFFCNRSLVSIIVSNLKITGSKCLYYNNSIVEIFAPYLRSVGDSFLYSNTVLENGDF